MCTHEDRGLRPQKFNWLVLQLVLTDLVYIIYRLRYRAK